MKAVANPDKLFRALFPSLLSQANDLDAIVTPNTHGCNKNTYQIITWIFMKITTAITGTLVICGCANGEKKIVRDLGQVHFFWVIPKRLVTVGDFLRIWEHMVYSLKRVQLCLKIHHYRQTTHVIILDLPICCGWFYTFRIANPLNVFKKV